MKLCQSLARSNIRGIVPVYGMGAYPGRPPVLRDAFHSAVDSLHQSKLKNYIRTRGKIIFQLLLEIRRLLSHFLAAPASDGVCPQKHVLHRDIKPEQYHVRPVLAKHLSSTGG